MQKIDKSVLRNVTGGCCVAAPTPLCGNAAQQDAGNAAPATPAAQGGNLIPGLTGPGAGLFAGLGAPAGGLPGGIGGIANAAGLGLGAGIVPLSSLAGQGDGGAPAALPAQFGDGAANAGDMAAPPPGGFYHAANYGSNFGTPGGVSGFEGGSRASGAGPAGSFSRDVHYSNSFDAATGARSNSYSSSYSSTGAAPPPAFAAGQMSANFDIADA